MSLHEGLKSAIDAFDHNQCDRIYPVILDNIILQKDLQHFTELVRFKSGLELNHYRFDGHNLLCYMIKNFPEGVPALEPYFKDLGICIRCDNNCICDDKIPIETIMAYYETWLKDALQDMYKWKTITGFYGIIHDHGGKYDAYFRPLIELLMQYDQLHSIQSKWNIWTECQYRMNLIDTLIDLNIPITEETICVIRDPILRAKLKDYYEGPPIKEPCDN